LTGSFKSTSGTITIVVPSTIGVEIETATTSGTVQADGLSARGSGVFANSAFGTTKNALMLSVRTESGAIKLRVSK
jgi:predicted membrane protein